MNREIVVGFVKEHEEALRAFRKGKEIILGPTTNGRFYLIGMTRSQYTTLRDGSLFDELDFNTRRGRDTAIRKIMQTCSNCAVLPERNIILPEGL